MDHNLTTAFCWRQVGTTRIRLDSHGGGWDPHIFILYAYFAINIRKQKLRGKRFYFRLFYFLKYIFLNIHFLLFLRQNLSSLRISFLISRKRFIAIFINFLHQKIIYKFDHYFSGILLIYYFHINYNLNFLTFPL